MKKPETKFPPGSEWLYFRIYGGPHALEEWLTGDLSGLVSEWKKSGRIRLFFFIHYLDPEYHLRLRFRLREPMDSGFLMNQLQLSCTEMLNEDLIWKIEIGTYEPEYERYGVERMPVVENLFDLDSSYWIAEIGRRAQSENQEMWKCAFLSVDAFFDCFGATLADRLGIMIRLSKSANTQFALSKPMKAQIDDKYRILSGELDPLIRQTRSHPDNFLQKRAEDADPCIRQLKQSFANPAELFESDLLPNLIHMSLNRAFRTRHRIQELLLYDFMCRYYTSQKARAITSEMTRNPNPEAGVE